MENVENVNQTTDTAVTREDNATQEQEAVKTFTQEDVN